MPLHVAAKALATRVLQSETTREIARNATTATAEALTHKALQHFGSGGPTARTEQGSTGHQPMPPRKDTLHKMSALRSDASPNGKSMPPVADGQAENPSKPRSDGIAPGMDANWRATRG